VRRLSAAAALSTTIFRGKFAATHFCALLFEDGFARETDAVAFDGQDFYQHLIAFFQFIADVFNAVLRDFADVQQPVGAGDDFDECAEVGQAGDCSEIGFADLGCGCEVSDNLESLGRRSLVVRGDVDFA
jgi:hypothetical protein